MPRENTKNSTLLLFLGGITSEEMFRVALLCSFAFNIEQSSCGEENSILPKVSRMTKESNTSSNPRIFNVSQCFPATVCAMRKSYRISCVDENVGKTTWKIELQVWCRRTFEAHISRLLLKRTQTHGAHHSIIIVIIVSNTTTTIRRRTQLDVGGAAIVDEFSILFSDQQNKTRRFSSLSPIVMRILRLDIDGFRGATLTLRYSSYLHSANLTYSSQVF